jgi:hypothetical protein
MHTKIFVRYQNVRYISGDLGINGAISRLFRGVYCPHHQDGDQLHDVLHGVISQKTIFFLYTAIRT